MLRQILRRNRPRLHAGPVALALSIAVAPSALAHTVLVASDPQINSTVTSLPSQISLTFADNLLQLAGKPVNTVSVVDSMNTEIASHVAVRGNVLSADLKDRMAMRGSYTVSYRVVALDGHVVTGRYTFMVGNIAATPPAISIPTAGIKKLRATLSGNLAGVRSSDAHALASLYFDFSRSQVCYTISTSGLSGITAIHVHPMSQGTRTNMTVSDEVFIQLNTKAVDSEKPICTHAKPLIMAEIVANPMHYAVMIHTKAHPDGAVAGWLMKVDERGANAR